jgi:hypothetical protein
MAETLNTVTPDVDTTQQCTVRLFDLLPAMISTFGIVSYGGAAGRDCPPGGDTMTNITKILLATTAFWLLADHADAQLTNGLTYACVNNGSGTIRVVAPNAACQTNEGCLKRHRIARPHRSSWSGRPARPLGATGPDHKALRAGRPGRRACG